MNKYVKKSVLMHLVVLFLMAGGFLFLMGGNISAASANPNCSNDKYLNFPACSSINTGNLGFKIPSLGDILTFIIRAFFVVAGLSALFYLLLGALAWVTSGGEKDSITAAREKIQAAVIGVILVVVVLAIIWTLEQVIFARKICLGLSCPLTLPGLIEYKSGGELCCTCVRNDGGLCNADNDPAAGCTMQVIDALSGSEKCDN